METFAPYNENTRMEYGKYKGFKIEMILENEPTYITYCLKEHAQFYITTELEQRIKDVLPFWKAPLHKIICKKLKSVIDNNVEIDLNYEYVHAHTEVSEEQVKILKILQFIKETKENEQEQYSPECNQKRRLTKSYLV